MTNREQFDDRSKQEIVNKETIFNNKARTDRNNNKNQTRIKNQDECIQFIIKHEDNQDEFFEVTNIY